MQLDQKILGKLTYPLSKLALALLDSEGKEVYRLVDAGTNIPDRIFGVGRGEWAIMDGGKPVAKLVWLPRQEDQSPGLFGKLKAFLNTSDRGIISGGGCHALSAPVALGMLMIFNEVTDISSWSWGPQATRSAWPQVCFLRSATFLLLITKSVGS